MGLCLGLLLFSCKAWKGFSGYNEHGPVCSVVTSTTGETAVQVYLSPLLQKANSSLNSSSKKHIPEQ